MLNKLVDDYTHLDDCQEEEQVKNVIQRKEASGPSPYVAYYFDYYGQGGPKLHEVVKGSTSWKVKHWKLKHSTGPSKDSHMTHIGTDQQLMPWRTSP